MKISAVIFDWAGTTVDYGCFAPVKAFMEIFQSYGIQVTMEETRKPMGLLKWDHIKTMLEMPQIKSQWIKLYGKEPTNKDIDAMHTQFAASLLKILDQFVDIKPYVLETMEILKNMGIQIGSTTGYTDEMMQIVVSKAKENGYSPDFWITPNRVNNYGRPYPYMIFENMKELHVPSVSEVIKVGDTISDIKEGIAAGVISVGILEGSSLMGLTKQEYEQLSETEKTERKKQLTKEYKEAGASYVISNMGELPTLIEEIQSL